MLTYSVILCMNALFLSDFGINIIVLRSMATVLFMPITLDYKF